MVILIMVATNTGNKIKRNPTVHEIKLACTTLNEYVSGNYSLKYNDDDSYTLVFTGSLGGVRKYRGSLEKFSEILSHKYKVEVLDKKRAIHFGSTLFISDPINY